MGQIKSSSSTNTHSSFRVLLSHRKTHFKTTVSSEYLNMTFLAFIIDKWYVHFNCIIEICKGYFKHDAIIFK